MVFLLGLSPVASGLWARTARAHGAKTHSEEAESHERGMKAVKDRIPSTYREIQRSPVEISPESLARGRALFARHCTLCHGEGGRGDGPAAEGMAIRPANFLNLGHSDTYSPGEKFWIITHGGLETGMPAFGDTLTERERWELVNHIRFLQGRIGAGTPPQPHLDKE